MLRSLFVGLESMTILELCANFHAAKPEVFFASEGYEDTFHAC